MLHVYVWNPLFVVSFLSDTVFAMFSDEKEANMQCYEE
jgi:hypothetical protein